MTPRTLTVALDISCGLDRPRTGVGYAAVRQAAALEALADEAVRLKLFATRSGGAADSIPELIAPLTTLPRMGALKTYAWTRWNAPAIERITGPCDIAHGLFHLLPAARAAKRVVTIHDLSFLRYPQFHTKETVAVHTRLVRHAAREADAIVAVSASTRDEIVALLDAPGDKVHVVHNGVDAAEFAGPNDDARFARLRETLGLGERFIIHLGTVEPRKNVVRLIEAFASIRSRLGADVQLALIGKRGWLSDSVFARIDALNRGNAIVHAGHLDRADAAELLRRARICVYPSIYEGFGLPVLEAMAAGTPVIASNLSAIPEIAGDAAWLVDPFDDHALADGIARLFADEGLRGALSASGRERATRFTWSASAESLLALYRRLAL